MTCARPIQTPPIARSGQRPAPGPLPPPGRTGRTDGCRSGTDAPDGGLPRGRGGDPTAAAAARPAVLDGLLVGVVPGGARRRPDPDGGRPAEEDVRAAMVRIYVNDTPGARSHAAGR